MCLCSIGYTTPASGARSSQYCSDVGKMINAPVLHVNGDYPEDVARAMEIAFRYRDYFRKVCFLLIAFESGGVVHPELPFLYISLFPFDAPPFHPERSFLCLL